jgi:transglutaminase-like putative cysteine protease
MGRLFIVPSARARRILLSGLVAAAGLTGGERAPDWLREASAAKIPAYEAKVPSVVLLKDTRVTVDESGRIVTSTREAIRILSREGRAHAYASQVYESGTSRVRDIKAWMLAPSGDLLKLGKETNYDRAYISSDAYDDIRVRGIDGRSKADPDSVFGFEIVTEDHALFSQFDWYFQNSRPTLLSRYVLTLPPGWRAESFVYNYPGMRPLVEGTTYTWEVRDLPFVDPEPAGPALFSLVPRLAITYYPSTGGRAAAAPAFASWRDVSHWMTDVTEAAAQPNAAVAAKAQALIAGAKTELERIRAIARFVQETKYVSIQIGLGRGGGYRPKPAGDVLVKEYGDCKDKATLMRALLRATGLESYIVAIYSFDRSYVREDWPSPQQFNHVIVAVKVSESTVAATVIQHSVLGRILLFDPTSSITPVGDLPLSEQGSLALVAAGDRGELIRTPMMPPAANRVEREIRATLDSNGTLSAKLLEVSFGQVAANERSILYGRSVVEFRKLIESWVSSNISGAKTSSVEPTDSFYSGHFKLEAEFEAPGYGQIRGNRIMVFKPVIVHRRSAVFLTERKRTHPVLLTPQNYQETVRIGLPPGFKVDELPDVENFEAPFGRYAASCEAKQRELVCTRTLEIRSSTIPVAQYHAVREFYERIVDREQTPAVLVRE